MKERGPNHSGIWDSSEQNIALGHTRLSIIDLDARSNQPFRDQDDIVLTFNGEIYNFEALRADLEKTGHQFKTSSDTEVIVKGYRQWGVELFGRLVGMFALGIVDLRTRQLFLARDRFGQKPLYLYQDFKTLLFCSDIRPIYEAKKSSLNLDRFSLDYYLTELSVPQPRTIWDGIQQLEPGTYKRVSLEDLTTQEDFYWQLPRTKKYVEDENEALDITETALATAVLARARADVPLGCFLSGGVDSGLVVALLAEQSEKPVKTFTMKLPGHRMDESSQADLVVRKYATNHTEVEVQADIQASLVELMGYCGEPFADSSILPAYLVSKAISGSLTVALSGDGGDELFGGYADYLRAHQSDLYQRRYGSRFWAPLAVACDKVVSRVKGRENLGSFAHYGQLSGARRMYRHMGFEPSERSSLWREECRPADTAEDWLQAVWDSLPPRLSRSEHLMRASLKTRLLNDYLPKVDRSSMLNSLEVRSPFMDHRLAEVAFRISPELKFKDGHSKYLLKRLVEKRFDPQVFNRKKGGFSIPIGEWLRTPSELVRSVFETNDSWFLQFFNEEAVRSEWQAHLAGKDRTHRLWALLCLEVWARESGLQEF